MKLKLPITAALAAAVLCLLLPGLSVQAADDLFTAAELDDGTVSIICSDKSVVHAEIPAEIDGHPVSELGEGCFDGCSSLETVSIPDTVTAIRDYAFQGCSMLDTVEIPASVVEIGDFVFEGCTSLAEIVTDADNREYLSEDGILFTKEQDTLLRFPAAAKITDYTLPDSCVTVAPWAFTQCRYLERVELPEVIAMGADAFMGCTALESVVLSDSITELIGATFANCTGLVEADLPSHLVSIGDKCFFGCVHLYGVKFPDTLKSIGEQAFFGCNAIQEMTLPAGVKTIGEQGIGYSLDSDQKPIILPDLHVNVTFGTAAHKYAKSNKIPYSAFISRNMAILVMICAVLLLLLVVGIAVEVKRRKRHKEAEAARLEEERRAQALAERRAKKRSKK